MTERRLGSIDLNLLEAVFADLVDTTFCVKSADLRYVAANPAMARFCGARRPSDVVGRLSADFFPSRLAKRYAVLDRRTLTTGRPITNKIDFIDGGFRRLGWLISNRTPVRDESGEVVGLVLIGRWLSGASRSADGALQRTSRAVERLKNRLDEPLNLRALAKCAGVSGAQLERDFRRVFSMSPSGFQRKLRIERAMTLLEGRDRIGDIALQCGFSDHSAFTRAFRDVVGVTPRAYRQSVS